MIPAAWRDRVGNLSELDRARDDQARDDEQYDAMTMALGGDAA